MKRFMQAGVLMLSALLAACTNSQPVKYDYTAFKESKPRSILVLPPINQSPDVNASLSMLSVATVPLAEAGYYVMPVTLVNETFKENGVTVANDAQDVPIEKLREIFGADAGLYITINQYGTSYQILNSVVSVSASAKLLDLRSGKLLWQGSAMASSAENQNQNSGGLAGMLISAVVNQVINNLADRGHDIANVASLRLLSSGRAGGLLYGPYNPKYGTD